MRVFIKKPPEELVLRVFRCLGLVDFNDERVFSRLTLTQPVLTRFDDILLELEPYYKKHKRFMVSRTMESRHYIQVIRNLCIEYKLILYTREDNKNNLILYRILNPLNPSSSFYSVIMRQLKNLGLTAILTKVPNFSINFDS